jgi:hypothetical protein
MKVATLALCATENLELDNCTVPVELEAAWARGTMLSATANRANFGRQPRFRGKVIGYGPLIGLLRALVLSVLTE